MIGNIGHEVSREIENERRTLLDWWRLSREAQGSHPFMPWRGADQADSGDSEENVSSSVGDAHDYVTSRSVGMIATRGKLSIESRSMSEILGYLWRSQPQA